MTVCWLLLGILLFERVWKWRQIQNFFRRAPRDLLPPGTEVDLIQPVVSGDPNLWHCLRTNFEQESSLQVNRVLVTGTEDQEALSLCHALVDEFGAVLVEVEPAPQGVSPKTHKLKAGLTAGSSEIVAFLDDDTMLTDGALELALAPLQDPKVGVVHGLPYYKSFDNIWSSLVACFVNAHSLLTYIPYLSLTPPLSINGMFYGLRRDTLIGMGGLEILERQLCDDFAVARAIRSLGLEVCQTTVRHPIKTHVNNFREYHQLIKRWFVFPSISILRQLPWNELLIFWAVCLLPTSLLTTLTFAGIFYQEPWPVLLGMLSVWSLNQYLDSAYLERATPRSRFPLMLLVQLMVPFQIIFALAGGKRIQWRGDLIEVRNDGTFVYLEEHH